LAGPVGVELVRGDPHQTPDFYRAQVAGVNLAAHRAGGDLQGGRCLGDSEVDHLAFVRVETRRRPIAAKSQAAFCEDCDPLISRPQ